MGIVTGIEEV